MIAEILARAPALEVAARLAYWRVPAVKAAGDALLARRAAKRRSAPQPPAGEIRIDAVTDAIRDMGVGEGDILVVHSSYDRLKSTGLAAAEINRALRSIVGETDLGYARHPSHPARAERRGEIRPGQL